MNLKLDHNKCMAAILGLIVGDALGVPVEFESRSSLKEDPVTDMRAFGTHNQPAGTWSDDSSMMLATMEWLREIDPQAPDYHLLMEKFSNWLNHGEYTPHGKVFDFGISTNNAIQNFNNGVAPLNCGGTMDWENGNGSLMRILPAALWCAKELAEDDLTCEQFIFDLSALTHGHMRSKMACLIYSKLIADLLFATDTNKMNIVENSLSFCKKHFEAKEQEEFLAEMEIFARLWDVQAFRDIHEDDISSSGYVVHTLEAAIWCFLNTDNYKDCVLKAVNLGSDTDTVAAVAGGLAGIFYGMDEIPKEWVEILAKKDWICTVEKLFVSAIMFKSM